MERRASRPRLMQAMIDMVTLPDLRQKILFTVGILVAFRFLTHVPLPGVNLTALQDLFSQTPLLGMFDLFSGGAMTRFSIATLGVYPYITASIIMQLLVPVIPRLQAISQEGELGQQRINRITHLLTIPMAALQGYGVLILLRASNADVFTTALTPLTITNWLITMTAASLFLVWLGELITERGVGNGISIIIFGGIVAGLPGIIGRAYVAATSGNPAGLIAYIVITLAMIVIIVVFIEAHRRIPVQYARSTFRGGRMYRQSGSTYVPLRVNTAGMIPLIFAIAVMQLPATIASYFRNPQSPGIWDSIYNMFQSTTGLYNGLYFLLVIGFTLFYTMVIFEQMNLPQTLQQQGGFIPGVRPGKATTDYLNGIIRRITVGGALFLALVAIIPFVATRATGIADLGIRSTAMLIAVGVALDTMKQLEAQLTMRRYEGFLK
jgi:preprotein translocase subunit SecY